LADLSGGFGHDRRRADATESPATTATGRLRRHAIPDDAAPPTQREMEGFYERLTGLLDAVDYFEGAGRPHMVRELRRIFNRSLLTRREVRLLGGIVHSINRARSRRPGEP